MGLAAATVLIASLTIGYLVHRAGRANVSDRREALDSIAVLPFVNVSNDSNFEYLSDGISDSIISMLSRLPGLRVLPLNSVMFYKVAQGDPRSFGKSFGVRAVLMGRMTLSGDSLLISTELVDFRENRRLWSEQYNRKLSDILVVENEIARVVADRLGLTLTAEHVGPR